MAQHRDRSLGRDAGTLAVDEGVKHDIAQNDDAKAGELREMAEEELQSLQGQRQEIEQQALELLHPKNAEDDKNSFIEIRAGTGGEEAALFAAALLRYSLWREKRVAGRNGGLQ